MPAEHTRYEVPGWGVGDLWTAGGVVLAHELELGAVGAPVQGTGPRVAPEGDRSPIPGEIVDRLVAFLAGREARLEEIPIDLTWATPFQRAVATALRGIPRGEVVSYGELAALAGHPGASRAVGTFCARNRFMLLVPCHRVVAATEIGGYGAAGVEAKRRLLALEGVRL
jgi:methylated-DNA-[protein]-cysteine S-methyltransferase